MASSFLFEYKIINSVASLKLFPSELPDTPPIFVFIVIILMKFSTPNMLSINTFKWNNSLSSHCIKINPSSDNNLSDVSSLFFMNVNHVEWLNLSLYLKLSEPVLYGGSIYINFTSPLWGVINELRAIKLFPLMIKLSLFDQSKIYCFVHHFLYVV